MRLSFGQQMRMDQRQILAPRMIQSMEILQLPIIELQERIDQELVENPCLEAHDDDFDVPDERPDREDPREVAVEDKPLVVDEAHDNADDFERLNNLDEEWPDTFEERTRPSSGRMEEDADRKHDAMANMVARPQTLQDYLHDQLAWFELPKAVRQMCDRIIYNLDSSGYLNSKLEDLVDPDGGPEQLALAEHALAIVQKLDPPGVGARDLRECLLRQLTPGMAHYDLLRKIIGHHLEDVAENRLPLIAKKLGCSIADVKETIQELHKLNPKPSKDFGEAFVPNVTPDIFVDLDDSGKYVVRLEDGRLPSLFISPQYRKLLATSTTDENTREYIKRKVNAAQWLIEAIEQRRNTVSLVAQAIVDHQTEFLNKGPEFIEPLKMQQIADKVGFHVTTISRAVDDKWIQTPRGIFPLRRFFVGGTVGADGEEVAWDAVRMKLQELVDSEDKRKPLSDDQLVVEMAKHGIKVARRTVTKYRKAMNIPSSRQRREWADGETPDEAGDEE
jgi:RNA polymerase sigma-54 factor